MRQEGPGSTRLSVTTGAEALFCGCLWCQCWLNWLSPSFSCRHYTHDRKQNWSVWSQRRGLWSRAWRPWGNGLNPTPITVRYVSTPGSGGSVWVFLWSSVGFYLLNPFFSLSTRNKTSCGWLVLSHKRLQKCFTLLIPDVCFCSKPARWRWRKLRYLMLILSVCI